MKRVFLLFGIAALGVFPTLPLAAKDTPQGIADAVLDAVAAGDEPALVELANRRTVDPWLVADALCRAGRADAALRYAECSKLPEAAALPKWISSWAEGDAFFRAQAALAKGDAHRAAGAAVEAVAAYDEAARLAVELGWLPGASTGFMRRGLAASRVPDHGVMLDSWERLAEIQTLRKSDRGLAAARLNTGVTYAHLGLLRRASEEIEAAAGMLRELSLYRQLVGALANLSTVQRRRGRHRDAVATSEEALAICERNGESLDAQRARALLSVAAARMELGRPRDALAAQQQALAIYEKQKDAARIINAEAAIGRSLEQMGRSEEALSRLTRVLDQVTDDRGRAAVLANVADVLVSLGRNEEARETGERALAIARGLEDPYLTANILQDLSEAYHALGALREAIGAQDESLRIAEDLLSTKLLADGHLVRSETRLALGDAAGAFTDAEDAIAAVTEMTTRLGEGIGATARARHARVFRAAIRSALELDDPDRLLAVLEKSRAIALLEALENRDVIQKAAVPPLLGAALDEARKKEGIAAARYRILHQRGLAGEAKLSSVRTARKDYDAAREEVRRVVGKIRTSARAGGDLLFPEPASPDDIRALLQRGEAFVFYALLPDLAAACVVTSGKTRIVRLGATEDIERAAAGVSAIIDPSADPEQAIEALRSRLAKPLGLEGVERILVSPDGALYQVPFSVVFPGREVAYVPSGTTYRVLLSDAGGGEGVLALGDPDYSDRPRLAPLSGSGREAKAVARGAAPLLGKDAHEAGLRAALATRPRWRALHLACHGEVDPDHPLLSALALTTKAPDDGTLTALEIFSMEILTDLTVLSACDTGRGGIYAGEGLLGLTRAFMIAGSPRVLVSQWLADDRAACALMERFHRAWGKEGLSAAAALRTAQAHVRSQKGWEHPYFWAGWSLWGRAD